ncbi:hypothetical protein F9L33_13655 [Amylibacter sp. SFDW26]|uniref:hypothetical protein n=1 Tax=Amylibacter sp. SFDW26 TaxID=2652722 RepID=UPI00126249C6|nr:hypothetical protein [Amylibacter sp. SFDW26]KAB7610345.1 hypothetical protein F9L33_13655 [Amylibacter sp. SFDW26]
MSQPTRLAEFKSKSVILLNKMRDSGSLGVSDRKFRLLEYLINEELEGRGERIKAYSIGVDILGKDESFDPSTNNAVRVEMGRLREALKKFYSTNTKNNLLHIEIPTGSYRPIISEQSKKTAPRKINKSEKRKRSIKQDMLLLLGVTVSAVLLLFIYNPTKTISPSSPHTSNSEAHGKDPRISVSIRKFTSLSPNSDINFIAESLSEDLAVILTRNKSLAVIGLDDDQATLTGVAKNGVIIDGYVRESSDTLHIVVELLDQKTKIVIWAQTFHHPNVTDADQDVLLQKVAGELRTQLYNASRRILAGEDPKGLSPWELYLIATWIPGEAKSTLEWEKERVDLARFALQLQPDFGQAHSVLADKLAYLASVDPPSDSAKALDEAAYHAQKAMETAPHDADVFFNLGIYQWHVGRIKKATMSMERVVELDPSHTMAKMLIEVMPYTCSPAPLSVIETTKAHDASLSPENPVRWVTLTWLTMLHLNRGELEQALITEQRTHQIFQTPDTIARMAVIMNQLGDLEGAKTLFASQKQNWPNLDARHFANVTMPRRCAEDANAGPLIDMYRDLAAALYE